MDGAPYAATVDVALGECSQSDTLVQGTHTQGHLQRMEPADCIQVGDLQAYPSLISMLAVSTVVSYKPSRADVEHGGHLVRLAQMALHR